MEVKFSTFSSVDIFFSFILLQNHSHIIYLANKGRKRLLLILRRPLNRFERDDDGGNNRASVHQISLIIKSAFDDVNNESKYFLIFLKTRPI